MVRTCEDHTDGEMVNNYGGMRAERYPNVRTTIPQMEPSIDYVMNKKDL